MIKTVNQCLGGNKIGFFEAMGTEGLLILPRQRITPSSINKFNCFRVTSVFPSKGLRLYGFDP